MKNIKIIKRMVFNFFSISLLPSSIIIDIMLVPIGWIIIFPISYFWPKKNIITFIGQYDGKFVGNVKYAYLYFIQHASKLKKIVFLTENKQVYKELEQHNLPVVLHPSFKSLIILLKTKVLIVDHGFWFSKLKQFLITRAYKIQLWHGVGLKITNKNCVLTPQRKFIHKFIARFHYHAFISTAQSFNEKFFKQIFLSDNFLNYGYPRNDILFFNKINKLYLINIDIKTFNQIESFKKKKYKIIFYAPTWRKDNKYNFTNFLDLSKINEIAKKKHFIFVIKFHPGDKKIKLKIKNLNFIFLYQTNRDLYPLLNLTDLLITDYSSIFVDYLLAKRKVLFYWYDYDNYKKKVGINDYLENRIMKKYPNNIIFNKESLANSLSRLNIDNLDSLDAEIKQFFDYHDGKSSYRLFNYINALLN